MQKLYTHDSLYDEIFAGNYTIFFMIAVVLVVHFIPWGDVYLMPWFRDVVEFQSEYFPNINKIREQLEGDRSNYFVAQQVFLNVVEWPLFMYVLYRIKPADKVISGEFTKVGLLLVMGPILMVASLYVMTSAGTTGGKLVDFSRQYDLGLTTAKVVGIWGGIFGWVMFFSTILGLFKKWSN